MYNWRMNTRNTRFLGVDYGSKRGGVAVSDDAGKMAFPREVLANDGALLASTVKLARDEGVSAIVIGESKTLAGEPNPIQADIERFARALEGELGLPVHFEPEHFTSHQAHHIQGKVEKLDASAAALILQSFLDSV